MRSLEAVKSSIPYVPFPCASLDCPWSWPPFHRASRRHECWPYVLLQCVSSHPISCQTFHIQCTEEIRPRPSPDTGQLHYPVLCQFLEIHSIKQLSSTLEHRTKFVQSIYFNSSHVSHISIFSGFYAHWTCECQKGLCCQN